MWITGSKALEYRMPNYIREPQDIDYYMTQFELNQFEVTVKPQHLLSNKWKVKQELPIEVTLIDNELFLEALCRIAWKYSDGSIYFPIEALYIEKLAHKGLYMKKKWKDDIILLEKALCRRPLALAREYEGVIQLGKEYSHKKIKEYIFSKFYSDEVYPLDLAHFRKQKSIEFLLPEKKASEQEFKELYQKLSYIYNNSSKEEQEYLEEVYEIITRDIRLTL